MSSPYKSSAAERIDQTKVRLGREIWSAKELPDNEARCLWWRRRWRYFTEQARALRSREEDYNAYNIACDERDEAMKAHRKLIREMQHYRVESNRLVLNAFAMLAADPNISPAFREAMEVEHV